MRYGSRLVAAAVTLFVAAVFPSLGMAIGCHCFQQRVYDPGAKFSADPYILASSFNSFLAGATPVEKRQIIMLKMRRGVENNDLVPSLYLAELLDVSYRNILSSRSSGRSWQAILQELGGGIRKDPVAVLIREGAADSLVAARATEFLISGYFGVPPEPVREYRDQGFNYREIVVALALSRFTGRPVSKILQRIRNGDESWGEIADAAGIEAENIGDRIKVLDGAEKKQEKNNLNNTE